MKIRLLPFAVLAVLFASCTSDSSDSTANDENITHFVETRYHVSGTDFQVQSVSDYIVTDNKLDYYTSESFTDGVSNGVETYSDFHYENGLLVSHTGGGGDARHFYYDVSGKLIGADLVTVNSIGATGTLHYRFVHQPGNVVFCEKLNAPYNDPAAVISLRNIMDFDDDDNIVLAGRDTNLDGEMEQPNIFTTVNGDITAIQFGGGTLVTYEYSNIVNNLNFLNNNSFGKQVHRLMCFEIYAGTNQERLRSVLYSSHLFESEIPQAAYMVNENNNFIKKKTVEENAPNAPIVIRTVTEYFFD